MFSTLGLKLLIGKAEELTCPDVLFISRSLAEKIREGNSLESVIGKTLSVDRKEPMSIRGVFEDMGENADIHFDVVVPMSKLWNLARGGWGYDISYMSIIRFRDPAKDIKAVEARIPDMLKKYMADSSNKRNLIVFFPSFIRISYGRSDSTAYDINDVRAGYCNLVDCSF